MSQGDIFEVEDNELEFIEISSCLKSHPFSSPWKMFFKVDDEAEDHFTEVSEFNIDDSSMEVDKNLVENHTCSVQKDAIDHKKKDSIVLDEKKIMSLRESILNAEETTKPENLQDVDVFFSVSSNELPFLFNLLDVEILSEPSLTLLLNIFLHYKDDISMTTATYFVNNVICPLVFEIKKSNLRSLLKILLQFSETYPKVTIDKMITPYLRNKTLDDQQLELFSQISKSHLPDDYIQYCIKKIIEDSLPTDSCFTILQNLIERRVPLEKSLYDQILKKLLNWTPSCYNNVKFTKLLTSILHSYGSEFNEQEIEACEEIILPNKTIIKKAAENLLKKLKQDLITDRLDN